MKEVEVPSGPVPASDEVIEALRWFIDDIDGTHTVMRDFDAAVARARAAIEAYQKAKAGDARPEGTPPLAALHDRDAVIEECAKVAERMVITGRSWNKGQRIAADALLACAENIRSLSPRTQTERKEDDK